MLLASSCFTLETLEPAMHATVEFSCQGFPVHVTMGASLLEATYCNVAPKLRASSDVIQHVRPCPCEI